MSELGDVRVRETKLCFHEFDNQYNALNHTFLITDYLQDKTWPNETGNYITP